MGIGLSISKRIVEAHGGSMTVSHTAAGGASFQFALDSLAKDGRLVTCGAHAGEVVPFDVIPFFRGQKSVIGSFVFTREEVSTCLALAAAGQIKPLVHATFPLDQAREAMALIARREHFGKIVLLP
jgi:NADPH:quinone reductase-like Zn-dependent oxidoreductase